MKLYPDQEFDNLHQRDLHLQNRIANLKNKFLGKKETGGSTNLNQSEVVVASENLLMGGERKGERKEVDPVLAGKREGIEMYREQHHDHGYLNNNNRTSINPINQINPILQRVHPSQH